MSGTELITLNGLFVFNLLSSPFYRRGNGNSEKLSNLRSHSWKVEMRPKSRSHALLPDQISIWIHIFMLGYKPSEDLAVYVCFQWKCLFLGFAK